jgi:hypothetical protein
MAGEGLISQEDAVLRIDPVGARPIAPSDARPVRAPPVIAKGLPGLRRARPAAVAVFDAETPKR